MARTQGQVLERRWKNGRGYALRFSAYEERQYLTLGMQSEGWTRKRAEDRARQHPRRRQARHLDPPDRNHRTAAPDDHTPTEPTFHDFASTWHADREGEVAERTTNTSIGRSATTCSPTSPTGASPRSTSRPSATAATRSSRPSNAAPRSKTANPPSTSTAAS